MKLNWLPSPPNGWPKTPMTAALWVSGSHVASRVVLAWSGSVGFCLNAME